MRKISVPSVIILSFLMLLFAACSGSNPIMIDPNEPGISQHAFLSHLTAAYNPGTGEVWLGAPAGWSRASDAVWITVDSLPPVKVQPLDDGGLLYKFAGDESSTVDVRWTDLSRTEHSETLAVTVVSNGLETGIGTAGLYPNRMYYHDYRVWVVNSGDDAFSSYSLDTLAKDTPEIHTPQFFNPWEAAFIDDNTGFITTLFGGVFQFDIPTGSTTPVTPDGRNNFASPNGVTFLGESAWVANPNPISYFPSEFGTGWVSRIDPGDSPVVTGEINAGWKNPQFVVTDGTCLYVSCSGTIDWMPPDYIATALDTGGVHVIDPMSNAIIASYDLGLCGPGPMVISPDGKYLYAGSSVAGWILRIDLENHTVLNDASNPIVISDYVGTYVPFLEVSDDGLIACASFNTDEIIFIDSWTGEINPYPFFGPVELDQSAPDILLGPQDAVFIERNGERGLLILTSVASKFHWLPI